MKNGINDLTTRVVVLENPTTPITQSVQVPRNLRISAGIRGVILTWNNPYDFSLYHQYQQKQENGQYGNWINIPKSISTDIFFTQRIRNLVSRSSSSSIRTGTLYSYKLRALQNTDTFSEPTTEVSVRIPLDCSNGQEAGSVSIVSRRRTNNPCTRTSCSSGRYTAVARYTTIKSHCSFDGLSLSRSSVNSQESISCSYSRPRGRDAC